MKRILIFVTRYIITVCIFFFDFSIGLLLKSSRQRAWSVSKLLEVPRIMGTQPVIPVLKINSVPVDKFMPLSHSKTASAEALDGNVSTLELLILNELILKNEPLKIFEIGTFNGRTSLNFALNSPPEAEVFTLDLPQELQEKTEYALDGAEKSFVRKSESGIKYKESGLQEKSKIVQLLGDSGNFDFSPYYNKINFMFIDGSHTYDYILNDSCVALKLMKNKSGIIVWHDYNPGWPDVVRALNELYLKETFRGMTHIENTALVILNL